MFKFPIIAEYGAKNKSHDLISISESEFTPSPLLLNFTDRPAGPISRSDTIYPFLRYEVIEDYVYIWNTCEDKNSERSGMVKSKVLIYPIHELILEDNLERILGNITTVVPKISDLALKQFFHEMLDNNTNILFFEAAQDSSYFFCKLWTHLSPLDRKRISYCFYLNPSQKGDISENRIIYSLQDRQNQWSQNIASENILHRANSRAANYLLLGEDTLFKKILFSDAFSEFSFKNRLQRIGLLLNFYDDFVREQTIEQAILTIRTCNISVNKSSPIEITQPLIEFIKANTSTITMPQLRSLANISLELFPNFEDLEAAIGQYFVSHFPASSIDEHKLILNNLEKQKKWWQEFIKKNIELGMKLGSKEWIEIFIRAIIQNDIYSPVLNFSPDIIEEDLIIQKIQADKELNESQSSFLESLALRRKWRKLYAFAVKDIYKIDEAVKRQLQNFKHSSSELIIIFNGFDATEIINFMRSSSISNIEQIVGNDIVLSTNLLKNMDFSSIVDLKLLSRCQTPSSNIEFLTQNQKKLENALLTMIEEQDSFALLPKLTQYDKNNYIADILIKSIDLSLMNEWKTSFISDFEMLIPLGCEYLITNTHVSEPPLVYQNLIAKNYLTGCNKFIATVRLISWNYQLDEDALYDVLINAKDEELISHGNLIGKYLNNVRFDKLVNNLFKLNKPIINQNILVHCFSHLNFWDYISFTSGAFLKVLGFHTEYNNSIQENKRQAVKKLAEELGELYSSFDELEIIWKKVGGKPSHLNKKNNPENSWFMALNEADNGKIKGGIISILDIVLSEYPNNNKLNSVRNFLISNNK